MAMNNMTSHPTGSYDDIIRTEVAMEVVNHARALVYARIDELEEGSEAERQEASRLDAKARELHDLLRSLDYREQGRVEAVIERWGPLVRDEVQFWSTLQDSRSLLAA